MLSGAEAGPAAHQVQLHVITGASPWQRAGTNVIPPPPRKLAEAVEANSPRRRRRRTRLQEPGSWAEEQARRLTPRRSIEISPSWTTIVTILGNLTDDRRKIERAPPERKIPSNDSCWRACGEGL